ITASFACQTKTYIKIRRRLTRRILAVSVKTLHKSRMVLEQLQRFLTQVELDAIMAHNGRDDDRVFYIHSNCHSHSPTWTRYEWRISKSRVLRVFKDNCNRKGRGSMKPAGAIFCDSRKSPRARA